MADEPVKGIVVVPEMSGKILDESHFDFHVTCKAKVINAVNKMKGGIDLLKSLTKLGFKADERWLKNTCGDPSVKALLEILEEYKQNEHRPTRARMIVPLIEYAIGLYASDLFFRERGSWFITQIIKRQHEFGICFIPAFSDPQNWYPLKRNSSASPQGTEGNYYKMENDPNVQPIEDDYKQWYNIDVNADTIEIQVEDINRTIEANMEWVKNDEEYRKKMSVKA